MILSIDTDELAATVANKVRESLGAAGQNSGLLSRKEAAAYLAVSLRTFDKLPLPRVAVTESCYRFRRLDLDRFATERLRD